MKSVVLVLLLRGPWPVVGDSHVEVVAYFDSMRECRVERDRRVPVKPAVYECFKRSFE